MLFWSTARCLIKKLLASVKKYHFTCATEFNSFDIFVDWANRAEGGLELNFEPQEATDLFKSKQQLLGSSRKHQRLL